MSTDKQQTPPQTPKLPDGVLDKDLSTKINNKGAALFNAGHYAIAEHFFRAAQACNPDDPVLCLNVLSVLYRQEKYEDTESFGREQYPRFKDNVKIVRDYATVLCRNERYEEAVKVCQPLEGHEEALKSNAFQHNYGVALFKTGAHRKAEAYFFKSNELEESKGCYYWLIECFEKNGTFAANEEFMLERLRLNKKSQISEGWRRMKLAQYYFSWSVTLALEDPEAAKRKLLYAQEYIEQAGDLASAASGDTQAAKDELKQINELAAKIQAKVNGFEPPSGFKPPEPG